MDAVGRFLDGEPLPLLGDDPRSALGLGVFTAAPLADQARLHGYVYVLLLGKNYDDAAQAQRAGYLLQLGLRTIPITLVASAVVALLLLWLLIRRLRHVIRTESRAFESGDLTSRVKVASHDEIGELGSAFNSMASAIVQNMQEIKRTDEIRRELIANLSHDLKTPLPPCGGTSTHSF